MLKSVKMTGKFLRWMKQFSMQLPGYLLMHASLSCMYILVVLLF